MHQQREELILQVAHAFVLDLREISQDRPMPRSLVAHSVNLLAIILAIAALACSPPSPAAEKDAETTIRVAAIQFVSRWARPDENRKGLERHIREAATAGAKIVVLPETAIPAYMSHDIRLTWRTPDRTPSPGLQGIAPDAVAESVPGESTRIFGQLAAELQIYLTVPILEISSEEKKYYNTVVLMGPDGKIALHYRKLNPWPWAERGWASPGDRGHQILDTPYGRLGLLICYDINSEPPKLKDQVDHLLYSIAWVDDQGSDWFREDLPRIARETNMNIIGANWSVPDQPGWSGYGQSVIIDRTGRILARAKSDLGDEILYADLPVRSRAQPSVNR